METYDSDEDEVATTLSQTPFLQSGTMSSIQEPVDPPATTFVVNTYTSSDQQMEDTQSESGSESGSEEEDETPPSPPPQRASVPASKTHRSATKATDSKNVRRGKVHPRKKVVPVKRIPGTKMVQTKATKTPKTKKTTKDPHSPYYGVRKPFRFKAGTVALRDIAHQQKHAGFMWKDCAIPRLAFQRLIREIIQDFGRGDYKWQRKAIEILQESTEMEMIEILHDAMILCATKNRVELKADMVRTVLTVDRDRRKRYINGPGTRLAPIDISVVKKEDDKVHVYSYNGVPVSVCKYILPS